MLPCMNIASQDLPHHLGVLRGAMEVARFRLTAGLPDPRKN